MPYLLACTLNITQLVKVLMITFMHELTQKMELKCMPQLCLSNQDCEVQLLFLMFKSGKVYLLDPTCTHPATSKSLYPLSANYAQHSWKHRAITSSSTLLMKDIKASPHRSQEKWILPTSCKNCLSEPISALKYSDIVHSLYLLSCLDKQ